MNAPVYKKVKKDKQKHQCPTCGGFNCMPYNEYDIHAMGCKDCFATWHEDENHWYDAFQTGDIIK